MATGNTCYRFLRSDQSYHSIDSGFELEESDLYASSRSESPEIRRKITSSGRTGKKTLDRDSGRVGSAPVNVPDWSKILREEYRGGSRSRIDADDIDGFDGGDMFEGTARVPPHEFLARTRMASFSVHEGAGRTLKGRDLSRVRNAIFEKIGFQD